MSDHYHVWPSGKANLELIQDCVADSGREHHHDQKRDEEFISHFARNEKYWLLKYRIVVKTWGDNLTASYITT